jgi:hypothetical protein
MVVWFGLLGLVWFGLVCFAGGGGGVGGGVETGLTNESTFISSLTLDWRDAWRSPKLCGTRLIVGISIEVSM